MSPSNLLTGFCEAAFLVAAEPTTLQGDKCNLGLHFVDLF